MTLLLADDRGAYVLLGTNQALDGAMWAAKFLHGHASLVMEPLADDRVSDGDGQPEWLHPRRRRRPRPRPVVTLLLSTSAWRQHGLKGFTALMVDYGDLTEADGDVLANDRVVRTRASQVGEHGTHICRYQRARPETLLLADHCLGGDVPPISMAARHLYLCLSQSPRLRGEAVACRRRCLTDSPPEALSAQKTPTNTTNTLLDEALPEPRSALVFSRDATLAKPTLTRYPTP